jgi:uncharacterized protein (DUF885 family)
MTDPQAAFDRLAKAVLDDYLEQFPQEAVGAGVHKYDGRITELGPGALADWSARLARQAAALDEVRAEDLDEDRALDLEVLRHAVRFEQHRVADRGLFRRSPMDLVHTLDPTVYLKREYAPLEYRCAALARHLGQIPRTLEEGRELLEPPLPAPDVRTAAALLDGIAELIAVGMDEALTPLGEQAGALADEVTQARQAAAEAVSAFGSWLRELEESGGTTSEFALGEECLARMLAAGEAVNLPLDRIEEIGREDLARNQRALAAITQAVDPDAAPADVLRKLDLDTPAADDLVAVTESVLAELETWLADQTVVDLPEGGTLEVDLSPPHLRWAFAWMSAPGPFETAKESFFYVTPPEEAWDDTRRQEWMTKFSAGRLRVVALHEAYPGHYVHHLHVRRVPSDVRRFFSAYSAWEAWAHYSEQLATEAGYRPDDLSLRAAQLGEALLRNVRLLVAIGMHAGGMSLDEAQGLFETDAHLAPAAARAEAVRGAFDPGFMNYTLGKLMLLKLRDDSRARAKADGEPFNLRAFHDAYLAYGPIPLPLVRRAMLGPDASDAL